MDETLNALIAGAVALLKDLPRQRNDWETARHRFRQFAKAHEPFHCELVIDRRPGTDVADYDILVVAPGGGGTIVLSWQPDDGVPWIPQHGDHWAANFVLTVNGVNTSIQSALVYLSSIMNRKPNLMEELINGAIMLEAMKDESFRGAIPEPDDQEIQQAVDQYRKSLGLYTAAATQLWLKETGLTVNALRELAYPRVMARKLREYVTARQAQPWFESHRSEFERVTVFRVQLPSKEEADKFDAEAGNSGFLRAVELLSPAQGNIETLFARDLPASLAELPSGAIAVTGESHAGWTAASVMQRRPAQFDEATRAAVDQFLFQDWLRERRTAANVRWHWM